MDSTVFGQFETYGDDDWYRAHFVAGQTYSISTNSQALLKLMLPDGTPYSPPVEYTNQITFVAPVTGDFWISATGYSGGSQGFYSFTVASVDDPTPASTDTQLTIAVGQTVSTNQPPPSYSDDWYKVDLTAGQSYLLSAGLADDLYLVDANGNVVSLSQNQLHFTPTQSGTYYAGIHPFGGPYSLKLEAVADDHGEATSSAGALTIGTPATGTWETGDDHDWYAVTLTAGNSYQFTLNAPNGAPTAYPMSFYDSTGQLVKNGPAGFDERPRPFFPRA